MDPAVNYCASCGAKVSLRVPPGDRLPRHVCNVCGVIHYRNPRLVVGTLPAWSIGPVLALAAQPVVGGTLPAYSLAVWHGFNTPFVMSLVALGGGIALYALLRWQREKGAIDAPPVMRRISGQRACREN